MPIGELERKKRESHRENRKQIPKKKNSNWGTPLLTEPMKRSTNSKRELWNQKSKHKKKTITFLSMKKKVIYGGNRIRLTPDFPSVLLYVRKLNSSENVFNIEFYIEKFFQLNMKRN